jgi:hypothetical protein
MLSKNKTGSLNKEVGKSGGYVGEFFVNNLQY